MRVSVNSTPRPTELILGDHLYIDNDDEIWLLKVESVNGKNVSTSGICLGGDNSETVFYSNDPSTYGPFRRFTGQITIQG